MTNYFILMSTPKHSIISSSFSSILFSLLFITSLSSSIGIVNVIFSLVHCLRRESNSSTSVFSVPRSTIELPKLFLFITSLSSSIGIVNVIFSFWRDLNPYMFPYLILSQTCLPIPTQKALSFYRDISSFLFQ